VVKIEVATPVLIDDVVDKFRTGERARATPEAAATGRPILLGIWCAPPVRSSRRRRSGTTRVTRRPSRQDRLCRPKENVTMGRLIGRRGSRMPARADPPDEPPPLSADQLGSSADK
jgi:hypothetical protein